MKALEKSEKPNPQARQNPRKIVAVGDLHGDFYRLVRILEAQQILISDTLAWNPKAGCIDLVLIGDYVDWRGEELEGDANFWKLGAYRLLKFIFNLARQVNNLKTQNPDFTSNFYPLLGNHDLMMLEGLKIFLVFSLEELKEMTGDPKFAYQPLPKKLDQKARQIYYGFLNWYTQGGDLTIESFGGLQEWKTAMEGELGEFLGNNLKLGVLIGDYFFSHSLPDSLEFYRPPEEILALPEEEKTQAREEFVWGRSIWGYDYLSGRKIRLPEEEDFTKLLERLGAKAAVVGHTPFKGNKPFEALGGKLINIDQHGYPGSSPWIGEVSSDMSEKPKAKSEKGNG